MIFKIVVLLNILWTDSVLDLVILSVFVLIILHFRVYMFIPILHHGFFSNHFHFFSFTEISLSHRTACEWVSGLLSGIKMLLCSELWIGCFLTLIVHINCIFVLVDTWCWFCMAVTVFVERNSIWFRSLNKLLLLTLRC